MALALASCDNFFDEKQIGNEGYEPSDVRPGMMYTFTDDDYAAVSKNAVNMEKALALCTPEDSSAYTNFLAIGKNKCFTEDASADMYASAILQDKFPYIDNGSLCNVTYRLHEGKSNNVKPFLEASGYTLTTEDYETIWGKRGVNYLTPASLSNVPAFLKEKMSAALNGKIVVLTYNHSSQEPDDSQFSDFLPYELTLAQLLAFPDEKEHQLTGEIGRVTSTTYGRFYLKDGSDSILVYGLSDETGNNKIWKSLELKTGNQITIKAKYSDANAEPQLINAVYVSHVASAPLRKLAVAAEVSTVGAIYQLAGDTWVEYTNDQLTAAFVLPQSVYEQLGTSQVSDPQVTIGKYLKITYPYAAVDDIYLVAYRGANGMTGDEFVYDGTDFVLTTGYVDETMSFEVKNNQWIPNISTYLKQAFVGEGLGKFTIQHINLDGLSYVWRYQAAYGATASAYVSGVNHRVEDWLVSPTIRLKKSIHPQISFMQAVRYGNTTDNPTWLNVMVTNNFTGDVTTTEWRKLEFPEEMPDGSNWTFLTTGFCDLSEYNGQNIVIAFRYNTNVDGVEVPSAPTWEIQQLLVAEPEEE